MPKLHNCYKSAVLTLSCDFLGEKTCQAPFRGSWWFLMDLHHHLLPWTTALLKLRNHNSRLLFETHRLNKHLGSVIGEKSQTQSRQKEVYYGHSPYYTVVAGAGFEPTNVAVKVRCLAAWLTRNIMPAGIQVIVEPSQAKSVVPCSWHWRIPNSRKSVL